MIQVVGIILFLRTLECYGNQLKYEKVNIKNCEYINISQRVETIT